ncbi:MAG: LytR family transcriptional regulator [Chloroflexi bacterium]|nr:LytR family transcriptional regulator [Chloroflexota bacterium]
MARKKPRSSRSVGSGWKLSFLSVSLILFVAGGIYTGYLFYATVKDVVAHAQWGASAPPSIEQSGADEENVPNITQVRTNILLLGTDKRLQETGPSRTDTIIVLTVDPRNRTAGMLSIPRDLWVSIPGYYEGRINTAHFLGERDDYPGGGPALAKRTVQYALGIPIHYYVRINFEGFEKLIDAIGGITINVQEPIYDEKYPDSNYGYMTVDIPVGVHNMDGETALQYARTRHGGSDFQRARRQQEVIKAIRDKVFSLNIPLTKIPEMLRIAGDSIQTDLSLGNMYDLAKLAREIGSQHLKTAVIDESMTSPQMTPEGAQVLIPNRERIREVVKDLFGGPTPTASASLSEQELIAQEGAKVEVQNGTLTVGLAQRTAEYLKGLGYTVVSFSNADRADYASTILIDYTGKANTVTWLARRLSVVPDNIRQVRGVPSTVDIRIVLGQDYAVSASTR